MCGLSGHSAIARCDCGMTTELLRSCSTRGSAPHRGSRKQSINAAPVTRIRFASPADVPRMPIAFRSRKSCARFGKRLQAGAEGRAARRLIGDLVFKVLCHVLDPDLGEPRKQLRLDLAQ